MLMFSTRYFRLLNNLTSSALLVNESPEPYVAMTQHAQFCSDMMDVKHHSAEGLY